MFENLNRKRVSRTALVILIILGASIGGVIAVITPQNIYVAPTTAQVHENMSVAITLNGVAWNNGSAIEWGTLTPSQTFTKSIVFQNNGTVPISAITLTTESLPSGWIETISALTTTLLPGSTATGTLTLTVPANAVAGQYSWTTYITTK